MVHHSVERVPGQTCPEMEMPQPRDKDPLLTSFGGERGEEEFSVPGNLLGFLACFFFLSTTLLASGA